MKSSMEVSRCTDVEYPTDAKNTANKISSLYKASHPRGSSSDIAATKQ